MKLRVCQREARATSQENLLIEYDDKYQGVKSTFEGAFTTLTHFGVLESSRKHKFLLSSSSSSSSSIKRYRKLDPSVREVIEIISIVATNVEDLSSADENMAEMFRKSTFAI